MSINKNIKLSEIHGKELEGTFSKLDNISELLILSAKNRKKIGITFIQNNDDEIFLSYEDILNRSMKRLGGMQKHGMKKDSYALLVINDNLEFVITFWACILGGIIPATLAYPSSTKTSNALSKKLVMVWDTLEKPIILTDENLVDEKKHFENANNVRNLNFVDAVSLDKYNLKGKKHLAKVDTTAFIQFSSGSTNTPKGVVLTHKNLLTNIEAIAISANFSKDDLCLSWMPFHHDMGLIGFHLSMVAVGMRQFNMTPYKFIKKTELWLTMITKHKITITGSPNFGYKLLLNRLKEDKIKNYDLSSLRLIFNGAEPISVSIMNDFLDKLSICGLKRTAMFPVYGMAEACLALSFPVLQQEPIVHVLDRKELVATSKVVCDVEGCSNELKIVDEGYPVNCTSIRITNEDNEVVEQGIVGEIQIKGENVTSGYINNPKANEEMFVDGWLKTGDTGFILNNRLSVVGRLKDIIFINGQNFYSHDIESVIDNIKGVIPGKVIVCGWHDSESGKEKVALFSTMRVKYDKINSFYSKILTTINETFGICIDYIVTIKNIPKTTSGKIQRFSLIDSLIKNEFPKIIETSEINESILMCNTNITPSNDSSIKEKILKVWAEVLEKPVKIIPDNKPFLSIGGSSIKAIEVLGQLEDNLNIKLSHDILIKCSTVNEMFDYILNLENSNPNIASEKTIVNKKESDELDEIAVISMSCRFPEAKTPEEFWDNIVNGKSSIKNIPDDRWDVDSYYSDENIFGKTYCKTGAFMDDVYTFDNKLFNIDDSEANIMDPQQRFVLELIFELIERSSYTKQSISGKSVAFYLGASTNSYYEYHLNTLNKNKLKEFDSFASLDKEQQDSILNEWTNKLGETEKHTNVLVDNILNMIAARAAQEYNLKGPSIVLDTACSSSLVSIHLACEELKKGTSEMAIAGGINLLLTPTPYIYFSSAGALSHNGQSKIFDSNADGFVPGEGAGLVLLKPLKHAIRDNDEILGIIKASEINNDGHSIGVMAPNPDGQREVIESLYRKNNINPSNVQYVETHGTGTKIGDPSEIRALNNAFSGWNINKNTISIGSVKANIGHLLSASGICSFIKVIKALNNKIIPPQINVSKENPMIKFHETPFYISKNKQSWDIEGDNKRLAAINSFGFGGTNCHILVEEGIKKPIHKNDISLPKNLLCLSANSKESLQDKINNLSKFLYSTNYNLDDVAHTENNKTILKHRFFTIASDTNNLVEKLNSAKVIDTVYESNIKVAMLFTGQGSQYVNMGKQLYNSLSGFRKYVDLCSEKFFPYINEKITDLLYSEETSNKYLSQTNITQPVVFTIDYSLGKYLMDLGVKPSYVLGHSIGEWVAACISGVVTLDEAAKLVSIRGRLMNDLKVPGSMSAVFTTGSKIDELIKTYSDSLWIAGYNVTHQVISGKEESMNRFLNELSKKGIGAKKLNVSQAFHTPLMEPMLDEFRVELEKITYKPPKIPIISNITAKSHKNFDPQYWLNHILGAVKFEQSVEYAYENGINTLVEAGSNKVLTGMARGIKSSNKQILASLDMKKDNFDVFFDTLGTLYKSGMKINWSKLEEGFSYNKLKLPTYPFEKNVFKPNFGSNSKLNNKLNNLFYEWTWEKQQITSSLKINKGAIVVFGSGKQIEKDLNTKRNIIYYVSVAKEFSYDGNCNFTINANKQEDYIKLFYSLKGELSSVIHMWNYCSNNIHEEKILENDNILSESLYSLIYIGKALKKLQFDNLRLMVITDRAYKINENIVVKNSHQGIAAVIGQMFNLEVNGIVSNVVDIDKSEYSSKIDVLKVIIDEIYIKPNKEALVVIRNNERFARTLSKIKSVECTNNLVLDNNDTIIITGGTGLIGSSIATEIANTYKSNIILIGRSKNLNENKLQILNNIQSKGSKVLYISVDISNIDEMNKTYNLIKTQFGSITGIIHAAGILDDSSFKFFDKDIEKFKLLLKSKIHGTIILDKLTANEPLKFFSLISSISASKKDWSTGLTDYAAVNYYLDNYINYRMTKNSPGKSIAINYSLWDSNNNGISSNEIFSLAVKSKGLNPLSPVKAVTSFFKALNINNNIVHILEPLTVDSKHQSKKLSLFDNKSEFKTNKVVKFISKDKLKNTIYGIISESINKDIDSLEEGANFLEIGISSIDATRIISKIGKEINLELYPTLIFEYQTPEELYKYIEKIYMEEFKTVSQSNTKKSSTNIQLKNQKRDPQNNNKDIAIIGIGLKIPGANNIDEYWDILKSGISIIKEIPSERWSIYENYSPNKDLLHTSYCKQGGFIDKPYDFDPLFFGMSPIEAEATDPQQRIFLQVAWEALQQSGYGGKYKSNKIGVFVGSEQNTYMEHFSGYRNYALIKNRLEASTAFNKMDLNSKNEILDNISNILNPGKFVPDAVAGNGLNQIAARVSHCLNLSGPSLIVNSACSSSLVSVHLACESILSGQSDMTIAGGVNLNLSATPFASLSRVNALSPTGVCYPFDKRANGMVLSEGASAVVLKSLDKAIEDNDYIYAVIKGSSINNDGHSQGITAPRPLGQAEAIKNAYINSNINPETVSYIETHGTATPLGDPIEIEGMTHAFKEFTSKKTFCGIGSVKSSIGHMLSASGLVSLIKVALSLKNKTIPHTVNYNEQNPNIDFANSPFYVVGQKPLKWESETAPLRAGVNAFGFGGTNAHVILEEAPIVSNKTIKPQEKNLLFLNGRNDKVVKKIASNLKNYISNNNNINLNSICSTINNSQKELAFKTAIKIDSLNSLYKSLDNIENSTIDNNVISGKSNPNKSIPLKLILSFDKEYLKLDIESICSRFKTFDESYKKITTIFENEKNINLTTQDMKDNAEIFKILYSIGNMFSKFSISIESIISDDFSVLAGAALTGIISIKEVGCILSNKTPSIINDSESSVLNCDIIVPSGNLDKNNIQSIIETYKKNTAKHIDSNFYIKNISKKDSFVFLGINKKVFNIIKSQNKKSNLIELNLEKDSVESILKLLSKLYSCGISLNPIALDKDKYNKILLPTYPFENNSYKISFEDESLSKDLSSTPIFRPLSVSKINTNDTSNTTLKKLNTENTLNENKKFLTLNSLKKDLNKINFS